MTQNYNLGFHMATQLRKGSFWHMLLAFFGSLLLSWLKAFSSIISTFSKEKSLREPFSLGTVKRVILDQKISEPWVPRVGHTQMSLAVLYIRRKGHDWGASKNNVDMPFLHFPMDSPNYLWWGIGPIVVGEGQIGWWWSRNDSKFAELITFLIWVQTPQFLLLCH